VGPTTNNTQVYASAAAPAEYYGLAVTPDGAEIYVSEAPINDFAGVNVTLHDCQRLPSCAAGGVDITQTVRASSGSNQNLSGAVTVGIGNILLLGPCRNAPSINCRGRQWVPMLQTPTPMPSP
jgi:hypothetical protein